MSEGGLRLTTVGLIALAVAAVILWRNRPARARSISRPDLGPGIHFFSSATCATCARARARLDQALPGQYREVRFEDDPVHFGQLQIKVVPSVMILDASGEGRVWEGVPSLGELRRAGP